jgi:hypothetical protein
MIAWSRIGLNPGDFRVCKQKLDQGADKLGSKTSVQLQRVGQGLVDTSNAWISFVFPPTVAAP